MRPLPLSLPVSPPYKKWWKCKVTLVPRMHLHLPDSCALAKSARGAHSNKQKQLLASQWLPSHMPSSQGLPGVWMYWMLSNLGDR